MHVDLGAPQEIGDASEQPRRDAGDAATSADAGYPSAEASDARACEPNATVTAEMTTLLRDNVGFGRRATGAAGCVDRVTTLADDGPGSLRQAAAQGTGPGWIVFDVDGEITLQSDIAVGSNKTIDGRGSAITLRDFGLSIDAVTNVIVANLTFVGKASGANNDGIHIVNAASVIWVDHCSLRDYGDEAIGVSRGATDVTISWTLIRGPNNGVLIGRSRDDVADADIRATLHHNWWMQVNNYAPRMRFGKVHLFNNLIDRWLSGAAAVTMKGQLASDNNLFSAGDNKTALATLAGDDTEPGYIRSTGDQLDNRAVGVPAADAGGAVFDPASEYLFEATSADVAAAQVRAGAGAR